MNALTETEQCTFLLDGTRITLGRDSACTVHLEGIGVSRHHAAIDLVAPAPVLIDNNSTFGIRLNRIPVKEAPLHEGDVITLGIRDFTVRLRSNQLTLEPFSMPENMSEATDTINNLRIGRDDDCDISLQHPMVSRLHAIVTKLSDGTLCIIDQNSANGTYVNGRNVERVVLSEGDIIQIGPYRLFLEQGRLITADDRNRIRLEAFGVSVRSRQRLLLDSINLSISPGEFVVILGPSGAGKTTLARVLTGQIEASEGEVHANGLPLKRFIDAFTSNIGYVAQHNLLHEELTVGETFREQSLLRLPRDSAGSEHALRIKEIIELLELGRVVNSRIRRLSGGEAKRVHLGIELLASPALVFLDEPLTGLDPGLVRKFMQIFRRICDRGHTLVLTTHTLEQIELCDRIVFVNKGRIVFQGQPSELSNVLGVQTIAEAYERADEKAQVLQFDKNRSVPKGKPDKLLSNLQKEARYRHRKPRSISHVKQFVMLVVRYLRILCRDRRNAAIVLLQAPLIALLLGCVFKSGDSFLPMSFYFCIAISTIWIGGINAIREIAREWDLLSREVRAGLSLTSYLLSKIFTFGIISFVQALLFGFFLTLIFKNFSADLSVYVLLVTGTVSGSLLGLCISACSGNVGRSVSLLPIMFIPQIFFSGIMIPFDKMTDIGTVISYLTLSRPVFGMFKQVCLINVGLGELSQWRSMLLLCTGLIILMTIAVRWHIRRSASAE